VVGGSFKDTKRGAFTSEDVRFTTKGETLYATCLGWPAPEASGRGPAWKIGVLTPGAGRVASVSLLGSEESLRWSQGAEGLTVEAPTVRPCHHAYTLRILLAK
jgi:alpha-L-fucosidase